MFGERISQPWLLRLRRDVLKAAHHREGPRPMTAQLHSVEHSQPQVTTAQEMIVQGLLPHWTAGHGPEVSVEGRGFFQPA